LAGIPEALQQRRKSEDIAIMKPSALAVLVAGLIATVSVPASAQSILVDMKGPGAGNPFWAAVERGALEKGKELGVEVIVLAPPTESDVAAQIAQVEDQLAKGIKGLVLAPTDPNALAPIVDEAVADGVPVVFIDTKG
jgi:ribose transport system substrate-binding protein